MKHLRNGCYYNSTSLELKLVQKLKVDGFARAPTLKLWRKRPELREGGLTVDRRPDGTCC
jgi:hypothetical protein